MLSTTTELKKGKAPLSQGILPLSINNNKKNIMPYDLFSSALFIWY